MKREGGFTLVELMVVVSITVLLLAWGIPSYSTWKKKHDIENQMVQLYSDLQFGRMTAYGSKVYRGYGGEGTQHFNSYQIRSDADNDSDYRRNRHRPPDRGNCDPQPVQSAITVNPPGTQNSVSFDGRGFLSPAAITSITFSATPSSGAAIDCVAGFKPPE